ncbi:hypothetical protein GA0115233_102174 [Streptomyces sp. DI166]|uniref:hypothetical protein n=1 Tax=Streptomyces sp. DI166 TaxID=1839783 RepID=UPI0007F55D97|nr:hypothetical protein [Streptomyces sp. DI166]SBT90719.1 hypothetical protein GA0115233_102174 [Streptomyces sp. DI166]
MTSAMARVLLAAAVTAALAATAACGGTESGGQQTRATGAQQSGATSDADRLASVFPGSDGGGSTSAIKLPRTQPGEPVAGTVHIGGAEKPVQLQDITWNSSQAQGEISQSCVGEVPPEGCDVAIKVTPTQPGPYSGELGFAMGDGSTFTVPVSGEAVGETDRTSAPPAQTTDTGQIPNTDVPPTDAVPTGVPTQVPSGYEIP